MNFLFMSSFLEVLSVIGYVLLAVLVLLLMITVHEFGHYIAGKILKFKIDEFAIGFGPKIFKKVKKNGEIFSVRAFPIGGFCAFHGEGEDVKDDELAFNNKAPWKRIIVLVSGALMNYLFALVLICSMFGIYGRTALVTVDMTPTTEFSEEYCFSPYDVIIKANGKNAYLTTDLMNAISNKQKGDLVDFSIRRGGKDLDVKIAMRCDTDFKNLEDNEKLFTALGVSYEAGEKGEITKSGLYNTSVRFGFFSTIGQSFDYSFKLAGTVFSVLGQLLTGRIGIGSMGGTVTTISVTVQAIKVGGFRYLLNIAGFIGVNLAVFNLLPIPALDGSHVVFTLIEWILKRPVNRKVEAIIHTVGLALLLCFAVILDLQRCF